MKLEDSTNISPALRMGVSGFRLEYHARVGGGIPNDEQPKVAGSDWLTVTMDTASVDGGSVW